MNFSGKSYAFKSLQYRSIYSDILTGIKMSLRQMVRIYYNRILIKIYSLSCYFPVCILSCKGFLFEKTQAYAISVTDMDCRIFIRSLLTRIQPNKN